MGNCFKSSKTVPLKTITIAVFGLDKAGKTSVIRNLKQDVADEVLPTVGFSVDQMKTKTIEVTIYDVGGGAKIREIWKNYFAEIHGLIFVVDASDKSRLDENKTELEKLLSDQRIQGKPCLMLLNKQDIQGAVDDNYAADAFNLQTLSGANRCHCKIELCTAKPKKGRRRHKTNRGIQLGFDWLMQYIANHFIELNRKVEADLEIKRHEILRENLARRARVEKIRAESEAQAAVMEVPGGSTVPAELSQAASKTQVRITKAIIEHTDSTKDGEKTFQSALKHRRRSNVSIEHLGSNHSSMPVLPPIGIPLHDLDSVRPGESDERKLGREVIVVGQNSRPGAIRISSETIMNGSIIRHTTGNDRDDSSNDSSEVRQRRRQKRYKQQHRTLSSIDNNANQADSSSGTEMQKVRKSAEQSV